MDPFCLVTTVKSTGDVMLSAIFSWHMLTLEINRLIVTKYLNTDHVHASVYDYTSSAGLFQKDKAPYHKSNIVLNWFMEHSNMFSSHKCHQ